MIGDNTSYISIKGRHFKGTRWLTELLTCKNVTRDVVIAEDLKRYKNILQFNTAHLQGYEPGGNVQTSQGSKFRNELSKLFLRTDDLVV